MSGGPMNDNPMNNEQPILVDLDRETRILLHAFCDGRLSQAEMDALSARLRDEPELQLAAAVFLRLHAELGWRRGAAAAIDASDSNAAVYGTIIDELLQAEAQAPDQTGTRVRSLLAEDKTPFRMLIDAVAMRVTKTSRSTQQYLARLSLSQRGWAAAWTVSVAAIILLLVVMPKLQAPPVAVISDQVGVVWSPDGLSPDKDGLRPGSYELKRGVVKLVYESGAMATFEGPCGFDLRSPTLVQLNSGVVYAEVHGPNPDFTVRTPKAIVRDLGTAFGVSVQSDGATNVMVMTGRVELEAKQAGLPHRVEITQARRTQVDAETGEIAEVVPVSGEYEYRQYPREVTQRVWLSKLLCQPESGRLEDCHCGLRFDNGQRIAAQAWDTEQGYAATSDYVPTPALDAIDGVFVPMHANGTVIDSAGHTFDTLREAPPITWESLWVGRPFHTDPTLEARYDAFGCGRSAMTLHGPKGFTIDLQRVSASSGGLPVRRFQAALWGRNGRDIRRDEQPNEMDFWILVDGKVAYSAEGLQSTDARRDIDVSIPANARFMTVILTNGEFDQYAEWITLDQAVFELEPSAEQNHATAAQVVSR